LDSGYDSLSSFIMVVGRRVVEVLLKGLNILNIKDIDKNKEHVLMGGKGININYYPKCPELNWQLEWAVTMAPFVCRKVVFFWKVNSGESEFQESIFRYLVV